MNVPALGKVYLVGAGPGDPGLITLRGMRCLQQAQVVLYDYLASPQLLHHVPAEAERICLGKHGTGRMLSQAEVNRRMIEAARAGKTVVRLKGGDPLLFARVAEELEALQQAGIPFEIVPGITAALGAGAYAGVPLTYRGTASAVALLTGRQEDNPQQPLDYAALARFPGTLVVYMGVTTAGEWSRQLIQHGLSAETPVALIRRCCWPDQQTLRCRLGEVPELIAREHLRPPVLAIVGQVAALERNWPLPQRPPLAGVRVLVTRAAEQAGELARLLEQHGAEVWFQPVIRIEPPEDWAPVDRALDRLADYHWLVFSSTNGVQWFFRRLWQRGYDLRRLGGAKLAAIGPATARALEERGLRVDCHPEQYRAERLAEALAPEAAGKRFLLLRASRGREVLAERLRQAGAVVDQVVVYRSTDVTEPRPEVERLLQQGGVHWITVTSSAIARSLVRMFGPRLRSARLVSISPVTSDTLRELGYPPAAEATEYTMAGVVEALLAAQGKQADSSR